MDVNEILDYMKRTINELDRGPCSDPVELSDRETQLLLDYIEELREASRGKE